WSCGRAPEGRFSLPLQAADVRRSTAPPPDRSGFLLDQPHRIEGPAGAPETGLGDVDHRHRPPGAPERWLALDVPGDPLLLQAMGERLEGIGVRHLDQRNDLHWAAAPSLPFRTLRRAPLVIKTTFRTDHGGTLLSAPAAVGPPEHPRMCFYFSQ